MITASFSGQCDDCRYRVVITSDGYRLVRGFRCAAHERTAG